MMPRLNSCKIYCDYEPATDCRDNEICSTNGYCKDVALLSSGMIVLFKKAKSIVDMNELQIIVNL